MVFDEKEARTMFAGVVGDFRQLLLKYDGQMNSFGMDTEEGDDAVGIGLFGGDPSKRGRLMCRFATALAVRQQIAMSMAEHDPVEFFDVAEEMIRDGEVQVGAFPTASTVRKRACFPK